MYLFRDIMDGNTPASSNRDMTDGEQLGFVLEADSASAPLPCKLVRGFQEAILAARDPRAPMPSRLVIVSPDVVTFHWLAAWSEDDQQVRRTISIRRRSDGATVIAVVTLAAFGYATNTALIVESLTLPSLRGRIVRSGVHPKSFLEAISSQYKRSPAPTSANDARLGPADSTHGDAG